MEEGRIREDGKIKGKWRVRRGGRGEGKKMVFNSPLM